MFNKNTYVAIFTELDLLQTKKNEINVKNIISI